MKWIRPKDELPKDGELIVFLELYQDEYDDVWKWAIGYGYYDEADSRFHSYEYDFNIYHVGYWMYVPEIPNIELNEGL